MSSGLDWSLYLAADVVDWSLYLAADVIDWSLYLAADVIDWSLYLAADVVDWSLDLVADVVDCSHIKKAYTYSSVQTMKTLIELFMSLIIDSDHLYTIKC